MYCVFKKFVPKHCTVFASSILSKIQTFALLELELEKEKTKSYW